MIHRFPFWHSLSPFTKYSLIRSGFIRNQSTVGTLSINIYQDRKEKRYNEVCRNKILFVLSSSNTKCSIPLFRLDTINKILRTQRIRSKHKGVLVYTLHKINTHSSHTYSQNHNHDGRCVRGFTVRSIKAKQAPMRHSKLYFFSLLRHKLQNSFALKVSRVYCCSGGIRGQLSIKK